LKPSFLADQNISPKTVEFLRKLGYSAIRVSELGLEKAQDEEVAQYARTNGLVIVTFDADFGQIYYFSGKSGGTIILRPAEPTVENTNKLLEQLLTKVEPRRLQRSLVIASEARYRIIEK